jgi:chromatin remodeling complex protein RSC6
MEVQPLQRLINKTALQLMVQQQLLRRDSQEAIILSANSAHSSKAWSLNWTRISMDRIIILLNGIVLRKHQRRTGKLNEKNESTFLCRFQVKRPGDKDVNCTILLLLDYQPMKFKVSPKLSKVLGIAMETRAKIIETLWQYIKSHKLQVSSIVNFFKNIV